MVYSATIGGDGLSLEKWLTPPNDNVQMGIGRQYQFSEWKVSIRSYFTGEVDA